MGRRGVGAILLLISALIFISKHICIAIIAQTDGLVLSNYDAISSRIARSFSGFDAIAIIALIAGIIFIIVGEVTKE